MNFDNLKKSDDIKISADRVGGGYSLLDTDVYTATVDLAYLTEAESGASALNLVLKTESGQTLNQQLWMTSGKAKGCTNTYVDKNGDKKYLPGFEIADALALLTTAQEIGQLCSETIETKTIKLYDYTAQSEVPTQVMMIMGLLGKTAKFAIEKQLVDKNIKNDQGKYVPSGETREQNEVVKVFRERDDMSVNEIINNASEAAFMQVWLEKNKGNVNDRTSKKAGAATQANKGAPASTGTSKKSLFA